MKAQISEKSIAALGTDAEGFAKLVAARIDILREYDDHEATVRRHAADKNMSAEDRWVTLAVPDAPADVNSAIYTTFNPDGTHGYGPNYEIVPAPLVERQAALTEQVNEAQRAAIFAVVPQRKAQAYQYRTHDIRQDDGQRFAVEYEKRKQEKRENDPIDWDQFHRTNRPVADTLFLDEQAAREATLQKIYRWAANLHSEIEDLTEATVDAYQVKPFHG
jgi:hypothetical protein